MGKLSKRSKAKIPDSKTDPDAATKDTSPDAETNEEAPKQDGVSLKGFGIVTAVVVGPYALYLLYHWLHLQSGLLRAPVPDDGLRQVLIVGTQSSGTSGLSTKLQDLGLEVEHEHSDARWAFTRDGTVSWFHGIRFLPDHPRKDRLARICAKFYDNMGFHTAMYRTPRRGCSYHSKWSSCWSRECEDIVSQEWGCALRGTCETPFQRNLLGLRHPMRTLESLVAKFCLDYSGNTDTVHPYLVLFTDFMFPWAKISEKKQCKEVVGLYYILYMQTMLRALESGAIDAFFRVEETGACDVARLAGFLNESTAVSQDASKAAIAACSTDTPRPKSLLQSVYLHFFGDTAAVNNRRNRGRVRLGYDDLWEDHGVVIRKFVDRLGYSE